MAKKFFTDIDLQKNKLAQAVAEVLSAAPSSPVVGQFYYDSTDGTMKFRNASAWVPMDATKVGDGTIPNAKLMTAPITDIGVSGGLTSSGGLTPTLGLAAATSALAGSMSAADKSKLDGIAAGATANDSNANLLNRANHTGTQTADTITDGTANKAYTAAEKTKLAGVATGATNTPLASTTPQPLGTAAVGVGTTTARADHVHAHGNLGGGALHSDVAAGGASGFMTGADKTKLDGIANGATQNASDGFLVARSNHTGTQLAATISNFDTQVRTSTLNQMAQPTAAVAFNNQKITGLGTPTAATDAATKGYVDTAVESAAAGIDAKPSVRIATTGNIALTGLTAIDGVTPVAGNRVLVKNQTNAAQNGVYTAASGAWARAVTADSSGELTPGAFWYVEEGTVNGKTQWRVENTGTITIGTTNVTINQFGAANNYTAGNGLTLTGSAFAVGAGTGIVVGSTTVGIDTAVVPRKASGNLGDGTNTSFTVTHNLNTRDVQVNIYLNSGTYEEVECDVEHTTVNTVIVRFATAPAANAYRIVIHG